MNTFSVVTLILIPIVTGLISSYATYYFTLKSKRNEAIIKFKEEKYINLLVALQGFVGLTASTKTKKEFFEEQYKSWLYCSDDVAKAINSMVGLIIDNEGKNPNSIEGRRAVGNIVLAMRKDLLGKTNLTYTDFSYTDVIDK